MKKILITLLALSMVQTCASASYLDRQLKDIKKNSEYNTVQIYKQSYDKAVKKAPIKDLKDPKLIKLTEYTPISQEDYNAKLAKDKDVYKKLQPTVKPYREVDYFNVYRISERIIRANNLDYVNWRIAIRKTVDDVNAASTNGNFVYINTALYDSLESNDDALAFVLGHEMAHQILGHSQRTLEKAAKIANAKRNMRNGIDNTVVSFAQLKYLKDSRTMEYMADAESFILLYKAGYSPQKAMEALYVIDALPNVNNVYSTHPVTKDRIKSAQQNIAVLDPNWVNKGRENIYNSEVLDVKKSGDRVSFVISKSPKEKKFYEPETIQQRLTRFAYMSYLNGNMEDAAKYFNKLGNLTDDYIPYLYCSYANEYLYKKTHQKKALDRAVKAIEKANELKPDDVNVQKQISNLETL